MKQVGSQTKNSKVYYHIKGTVCLIGHGSIGKGVIPLLKRHFTFDRLVVIDPVDLPQEGTCDQTLKLALTPQNYKEVLDKVFEGGHGFCVNVSVGTSSRVLIEHCQSKGILYIDTVKEEWEGFYSDPSLNASIKSNYGIRHAFRQYLLPKKYKSTAITCCGANPGMVSWFVKKALIDIANQTKYQLKNEPQTHQEWAKLMMNLGVKGIHIAERDTQRSKLERPINHFWNTWSVDGFIAEGFYQPSQIGWGTNQKWLPANAKNHQFGNKCGIYLTEPGMNVTIKTWCPTPGPQIAYMITHDQSLSIADYYSVKQGDQVIYRPTVNYAYHPCADAVQSCVDLLGSADPPKPQNWKILNEEIVQGIDQLGVLVYGHSKNAYWFGSQLSIQKTREMVADQNATGLQVTSAIIAGMVWAIQNPEKGVVQTNQMDYKRCLQVQRQYIQPIVGIFTDWHPLKNKSNEFNQDAFDLDDPWQFKNIIMHK